MTIKQKEKKIKQAIKIYSKHIDSIKTLNEIIGIYNRNWDYLQEKHNEYTSDDSEWGDGEDIPSEYKATQALKQITKIK